MNTPGIARALKRLACISTLLIVSANAAAVGYTAQNGKVYDPAGQEIQLRGISHFGFNTLILQPQYLWQMGWKEQIAQIHELGFNAVRVPYVPDTLYNTTPVEQLSYVDANRNPELIGKTPLEVLDLWMAEAERVGLYILLDFHSVSKVRLHQTWYVSDPSDFDLIYNGQAYTADDWRRDLVFVAERYAHLPHFLGIDVYNEPNGVVRWSVGDPNMTDPANYWKAAAESAAEAILTANPNLLIFVQGILGNHDGVENSGLAMNWGENFQPQAYQPLDIPYHKLVLTPHTYGPDVYPKSTFDAPDFPDNLAAQWEQLFGQFAPTYTVVPGEWGGRYGDGLGGEKDVVWQNSFVDYLLSKDIRNSFYWTYTPNSGDTGGILLDDLQVHEGKMALLERLWSGTSSADVSDPAPVPEAEPVDESPPAPEAEPVDESPPAPEAEPVDESPPAPEAEPADEADSGSSTGASTPASAGGGGAMNPVLLLALAIFALAARRRSPRARPA